MRRRLFVLLALAIGLAVPPATAAHAVVPRADDQLEELSKAVDTASANEDAIKAQLVQVQSKQSQLDARLRSLQAQASAAAARVDAINAQIAELVSGIAVLQGQIDTTQSEIDQVIAGARDTAVQLYKRPAGVTMGSLLTGAGTVGHVVEGTRYLERVSERRRQDLQKVARLKSELQGDQTQLVERRKAADAARADADAAKSAADELVAQQAKVRSDGLVLVKQQQNLLAQATQERQERELTLDAELDRRIREQCGTDCPSLNAGGFLRPVSGPITSPYGSRVDPITHVQSFHPGIDLGAACGTPIRAAGTGVVLSAGWNSGGYGNLTVIDHGAGLTTFYGHQSSIAIATGQKVFKGDVIGYVGTTGYSTGCHLHWEVRVFGNTVNPLLYL